MREDAVGIVDEADNVMLDAATNPEILANRFEIENAREILIKAYHLATSGKNEIEMRQILSEQFPDAKFTEQNVKVLFDAAKRANESVKGKDYIVREEKVLIIDQNTGFVLNDSHWGTYMRLSRLRKGSNPDVIQWHKVPLCQWFF